MSQPFPPLKSSLLCSIVVLCIHRITQKHATMKLCRVRSTTQIRMRTFPVCSFRGLKRAPVQMRSTSTSSIMQQRVTAWNGLSSGSLILSLWRSVNLSGLLLTSGMAKHLQVPIFWYFVDIQADPD